MTRDPQDDTASSGARGDSEPRAHTAETMRNPRATRKSPDMPEDAGGHRTDPEDDYPKPDGSERGTQRGS